MRYLAPFLLLSGLLLCIGCFDDDPAEPDEGPGECEFNPMPPDGAVILFKDAYENMNITVFESLIHEDLKLIIPQSIIDIWQNSINPLTEEFLTYDQMVVIQQNIFSSHTGSDPAGNPVGVIESIAVNVLDKASTWEPVEENDEHFAGIPAYKARYNLLMYVNYPENYILEINQPLDFYALQNEAGDCWTIVGISPVESTLMKGLEEIEFSNLMALYR
ncbi:MAG: hypothetical protein GY780_07505 [bacterium]|nr:hypothetical protein [bacterium]